LKIQRKLFLVLFNKTILIDASGIGILKQKRNPFYPTEVGIYPTFGICRHEFIHAPAQINLCLQVLVNLKVDTPIIVKKTTWDKVCYLNKIFKTKRRSGALCS
jgi:hypothetical protein